jgi:primosomal protein N' (replication factor Y) (superfamily II helicase)
VVDLTSSRNWPLSADLVQVLKQVAERGRQAIVLSPRRGFSAALGCSSCGYLAHCPNCDLTLRYHRQPALLRCHQCGYQRGPPALCPECASPDIGPMRGAGTEWLMREIRVHLPETPIYHYDADRRDDLRPLLDGAPGVGVATTALLRHPPLPNASLLAVTLLDTLLSASDFRAEEEVLRLLLNLAELQPQRRPLTLVQTFQPEHPVLAALRADDPGRAAQDFMEGVLERRRQFRYPPYSLLVKVQVSARDRATAEREAAWLAGALRQAARPGEDVLGPSPAPVPRLRGLYNQQLFVRAGDAQRLARLLEPARAYSGRARVRLDVDPRDAGAFLE